jgi:hypothetical protein
MRAISPARIGCRIVVSSDASWFPVAARHHHGPTPPLLFSDCRGQEVVCLEAWRLRVREAASRHEFWQDPELLNELVVKAAPDLVACE